MDFRIPVWYELKLLFMAWLVLPTFRGAAFIYDKFVREQVKRRTSTQAASAASTGSSNVSASKDNKILSTSPKEKKPKRKLLSMAIPKMLKF